MAKRSQKHLGDQAEEVFRQYALISLKRRIARLDKLPTPAKNVGGKIVYCEKSTVDYIGMMLDGSGRHVAVEVKRCSGTSFPLANLKHHQRQYLEHTDANGGVAALALVCPEFSGAEVFVVPWREVSAWIERERKGGPKSVNRDLWQPFRVSPVSLLASFCEIPGRT